ncbi:envelope stress response membrane protein PspB [Novosphingopyxis sp.]|uniref:envelope stress response membrane protein PspB n=1 Tax=Novosphingopyxis sp. TaxID=2709690 RepID=UPI003B5B8350
MTGFFAIAVLFLGLPWLIFHYVTKWKTSATLTNDDEKLLGDMYDMARRFEERIETIERIIAADNPDWRPTRLEQDEQRLTLENIRSLERNR